MTDKREKWFESRIAFSIYMAGIAITCVLAIWIPISKIQSDIAVIQSNHEVHIQDINNQLKIQNDQILKLENQQTDLLKQTTETQTLIKIHMGIK
jgi:hypothetical protein